MDRRSAKPDIVSYSTAVVACEKAAMFPGCMLEVLGVPTNSTLGCFCNYPKTPSIQVVLTLGSKVYKWYLLWAIWGRRVNQNLKK